MKKLTTLLTTLLTCAACTGYRSIAQADSAFDPLACLPEDSTYIPPVWEGKLLSGSYSAGGSTCLDYSNDFCWVTVCADWGAACVRWEPLHRGCY